MLGKPSEIIDTKFCFGKKRPKPETPITAPGSLHFILVNFRLTLSDIPAIQAGRFLREPVPTA